MLSLISTLYALSNFLVWFSVITEDLFPSYYLFLSQVGLHVCMCACMTVCVCYLSSDILHGESDRVHPTRTGGSARTVMSQQLYRKADTHTYTHPLTNLLRQSKQCPLYSVSVKNDRFLVLNESRVGAGKKMRFAVGGCR